MRVIVEKVNFIKRHTKARAQGVQSGILEREAPIHISNVMLYDDKAGTRHAHRLARDAGRRRASASRAPSGETIAKGEVAPMADDTEGTAEKAATEADGARSRRKAPKATPSPTKAPQRRRRPAKGARARAARAPRAARWPRERPKRPDRQAAHGEALRGGGPARADEEVRLRERRCRRRGSRRSWSTWASATRCRMRSCSTRP